MARSTSRELIPLIEGEKRFFFFWFENKNWLKFFSVTFYVRIRTRWLSGVGITHWIVSRKVD